MEDISLMKMNGDQSLKLSSLYLGQILCGHIDEGIQYVEEDLVSGPHDLLVRASIGKSYLCVSCPDKLNAKDPNLSVSRGNKKCMSLWIHTCTCGVQGSLGVFSRSVGCYKYVSTFIYTVILPHTP